MSRTNLGRCCDSWSALKPRWRVLSTASVTAPGLDGVAFSKPATTSTIVPSIASTLAASRSASFINGLSQTHSASLYKPASTHTAAVKQEIVALLSAKRYDALLKILVKWTSRKRSGEWQQVISHRELSHVLQTLVTYQIGLITQAGTASLVEKGSMHTSARLNHAHSVRDKIRRVYGNIAMDGNLASHIYARENRVRLDTAWPLSTADYENLITLELNNGKLDLASKWFSRFEQQFPDGMHLKHMTHRLWLLKFQVYGGALPALWKVEASNLYEKQLNPRRSRLRAESDWLEVFNDFISNQAMLLGNLHYMFEHSVLSAIIFSIAYSRNVSQLTKIIELNWGISARGKLLAGFSKPQQGHPLYPDLDTLKTVVVSMLYNKEYVRSMAYMNGFQEHYGIEINLAKAKHFWDQIFRWSEIQTRFSEYRALQHFIQKTATTLLKPTAAEEVELTLQEAQKSADFDYEGYLKFVGDLRNQRTKLIEELWKAYHKCLPGFSVRVYHTYFTLLDEHFDETRCYDYMAELAVQHHLHYVSPASFNRVMVEGRLTKICHLFEKAMKLLINYKGSNGDINQIETIIDKWSLDPHMRRKLSMWAAGQHERFLQDAYERKRSMEQSEEEEEEEGLLGLMS